MIHYLSHLKENESLKKIPDDILRELLALSRVKTFSPKDNVLSNSELDDNFYYIVKGIVKGFFVQNKAQFCLRFFRPGEIIVDFKSVLFMPDNGITYECVTHVTAVYISKESFYRLMEDYGSIKHIYIENLAAEVILYEERIRSMLSLSARERYQKFTEKFGDYMSYLAQKDIASYLSITPETLSRIKRSTLRSVEMY
jgi:CRP-like cAMP-binding protein